MFTRSIADSKQGAVALWRAELVSNPSEKSGGECRWSAYYLALCYRFGFGGVEQNDARAAELFHKAADEYGNSVAMYRLAHAYEGGTMGLDKDDAKALEYLRKASDAGYAYASGNLGQKYEHGKLGLDVNLEEAARLYEIAIATHRNLDDWMIFLDRVRCKIAGTYESSSDEISSDDEEEDEEEEEEYEEEEEGEEEEE